MNRYSTKFHQIFILIVIILSLDSNIVLANEKRIPKYKFSYIDREHSAKENAQLLGIVYGLSWVTYFATQPETFIKEGSFKNYRNNFGRLVLDKDDPFWNWFVHPYSGSQLYLFYRANGYDQISSIFMSTASSSMFEFFVEIYTEPASIQDLYQTPILGSALGLTFEKLSLYLLNTGNPIGRIFGHILNPATLLPFYKGKILISPQVTKHGLTGLNFVYSF